MKVHFCPLDRECRALARRFPDSIGTVWRVQFNTKRWRTTVSRSAGDRVVARNRNGDLRSRWVTVDRQAFR